MRCASRFHVLVVIMATACASQGKVWLPSFRIPWDGPPTRRQDSDLRAAPPSRANFVLRGRLLAALSEVESAMQAICRSECGEVELVGVEELGSRLAMATREPGRRSLLYYDLLRFWPSGESYRSLLVYAVAHEYGHHLDLTMQDAAIEDRWSRELRADALAGCALTRANVDLGPALRAMRSSAAPAGSAEAERELVQGSDDEHPALRWSMLALNAGARSCTGRMPAVADVASVGQRIAATAHARAKTDWVPTKSTSRRDRSSKPDGDPVYRR
jgi:hypothetical protein